MCASIQSIIDVLTFKKKIFFFRGPCYEFGTTNQFTNKRKPNY